MYLTGFNETSGALYELRALERIACRLGKAWPFSCPLLVLTCLLALGTSVSTATATAPTALTYRVAGPFGSGAAGVWVLKPNRRIRAVVVFGHGWKVAPPSHDYPWVGQFKPWLDHLLGRGNAIIFPRYQLGNDDPQDTRRVVDFETGVRTGYAYLGRPDAPFVVIGYSFGASLAFYYAANATRLHLPRPRAIDAVFPAGLISGAFLPTLAPSIRVLIQVGDADTEAGRGGADEFWRWLTKHPSARKRYEVVRSTTGFTANHAAPKGTTPVARAIFWAPLDRLIAAVSASG